MRTELRALLGKTSGANIDDHDYVGFFLNSSGEYLVFKQVKGEPFGSLLHSDADWVPTQVTEDSVRFGDGQMLAWRAGSLILDQAEAAWLMACMEASAWFRSKGAKKAAED